MLLRRFHQGLAHVRILDPACGSGNFLYVTLQKLKDLEKEVAVFTLDNGLTAEVPLVGPWQRAAWAEGPKAFLMGTIVESSSGLRLPLPP